METIRVKINLREQPSEAEQEQALTVIATELEDRIKEKFENLGFREWLPRRVPNIAGILEDLRQSANVKNRRFSSRQTGVDTGIMRNSVGVQVRGNELIFSAIRYAEGFHQGGTRRISIDSNIKRNLTVWSRKRVAKTKIEQFNLGRLFQITKKPFYEFIVPARPLVTKEDVEIVVNRVYKRLGFL